MRKNYVTNAVTMLSVAFTWVMSNDTAAIEGKSQERRQNRNSNSISSINTAFVSSTQVVSSISPVPEQLGLLTLLHNSLFGGSPRLGPPCAWLFINDRGLLYKAGSLLISVTSPSTFHIAWLSTSGKSPLCIIHRLV